MASKRPMWAQKQTARPLTAHDDLGASSFYVDVVQRFVSLRRSFFPHDRFIERVSLLLFELIGRVSQCTSRRCCCFVTVASSCLCHFLFFSSVSTVSYTNTFFFFTYYFLLPTRLFGTRRKCLARATIWGFLDSSVCLCVDAWGQNDEKQQNGD